MAMAPNSNRGRIVAAGILAAILGALFLKIHFQRQRPAGEPLTAPSAPPASLRPRTGRDFQAEVAPGVAAAAGRPTARQAARAAEAVLGEILAAHSRTPGREEVAGLLQSVHAAEGRVVVLLSAAAQGLLQDAAIRSEIVKKLKSALEALGYMQVVIRVATAAGQVVDLGGVAVEK